MTRRLLALVAATAAALGGSARADLLHEYNLIVTGDLYSDGEVEGRTIVGGNLTGPASNYAIKLNPSSSWTGVDTLIVGGNLDGSAYGTQNIQMNAGTLRYGGSRISTNVNLNGVGSQVIHDASVANIGTTARAELLNASSYFDGLTANSTAALNGSNVTFTATPVGGVAVFDIAGSLLNTQNALIELAAFPTTPIVINVSGTSIVLPNSANFGNNFRSSYARANVIWNFHEATSITLNNAWYGAVLAPEATLNTNHVIEGSVFVKTFHQTAEVHLPNYVGLTIPTVVPEPASFALVGLGLPVAWMLARRRR